MTDIELIEEKESPQIIPFSTAGYLVWTTFWTAMLPGLFISALIALFFSITPAVIIAFPVFLITLVFFYGFNGFRKRFVENVRNGTIPNSFLLRYLPFCLPLFYVMAVAATAIYFVPVSMSIYRKIIFFGLAQDYFLIMLMSLVVMPLNGIEETVGTEMIVPFIATLLVAMCGAAYVLWKSSPATHRNRGLVVLTGTFVVLTAAIVLTYSFYCTEVLPLQEGAGNIIQDELGRKYFGEMGKNGDGTDLSAYQPFSENNKLVKITSPTLRILSEHPSIHGALALYPVYAAAVEAAYYFDKTKNKKTKQHLFVAGGASPTAFEHLLGQQSDMIFMLQPSEKQLKEAEAKGIKLKITPIGHEAFVFFVSKTNPVDDLTVEQIRDIYSKRITRWNKVGGTAERIMPFQRPEGSGSQTMMLKVMGDVPLAKPLKEEFQRFMGGIVNRVADYRNYGNSIGFSFRYYVEGMFKHDGVKLLKINGIEPTAENIQSGKYPLIGDIVIITIENDNPKPNVQKLTDWFLSPQGQELIEKVGYVPL
jgi:phosphate transport system substrate-binding protein